HVLEEVRNAVFGLVLLAGARAQPDADRDGAHDRHGLGNDGKTVRENVFSDARRRLARYHRGPPSVGPGARCSTHDIITKSPRTGRADLGGWPARLGVR